MATPLRHWGKQENKDFHERGFQAGLKRTYSKNYVKAMNPYFRLGYLEGQIEAEEIMISLMEGTS